MMNIQDFIIEATKGISVEILKRNNFTVSHIGKVLRVKGDGKAEVSIDDSTVDCILPANMVRFVTVGDIVVVQDLHNNRSYMVIHGVIKGSGVGNENNIIHVYDDTTNSVVSSVMQVWNESTGNVVSTTFKVY